MWKHLKRPVGGITVVAGLLSMPSSVFAAEWAGLLNPIIPQDGACFCPGSAMDWGCVVQVIQGLINLGITFGTLFVIFFIMYAAVMMLVNPNSPAERTKAKNRLFNAVFGLVVMLSAWLVVDYIMKVLYDPSAANFGPWNAILAPTGDDYCIKPTQQGILTTGILDIAKDVINPGTVGSVSGGGATTAGGACSIPSYGACSPAVLERTCFGNRANQAAQICYVESRGRPDIASGSDRLNGGSGPSYSVGMWQINLTTSKIGGLNCPAAFDKPCQGSQLVGRSNPGACYSKIVNQDLYNRCVAAAKNPEYNTQVACELYRPRGFQPWAYTANKCNIPYKL